MLQKWLLSILLKLYKEHHILIVERLKYIGGYKVVTKGGVSPKSNHFYKFIHNSTKNNFKPTLFTRQRRHII